MEKRLLIEDIGTIEGVLCNLEINRSDLDRKASSSNTNITIGNITVVIAFIGIFLLFNLWILWVILFIIGVLVYFDAKRSKKNIQNLLDKNQEEISKFRSKLAEVKAILLSS